MTKRDIDIILVSLKEYVKDLLSSWALSDEEKSLVAFEQKYMPYTEYSGKQSIDHVLFRRFLRHYDPQKIEDSITGNVINIYKERIEELEKTNASLVEDNEELRKKLKEVENIAYAGL